MTHFLPQNTIDINECLLNQTSCSQTCTNTNGSYTCSCRVGFLINADNRTCNGKFNVNMKITLFTPFNATDINECNSSNGGCSHACNNTIGSYICSCRTGYQLDVGGTKCTRKSLASFMLISTQYIGQLD